MLLAERHGRILPTDPVRRGTFLSWMMCAASSIGPYAVPAVHFSRVASATELSGRRRDDFKAERHRAILDTHPSGRTWMPGAEHTILDMAVRGWARAVGQALGDTAAKFSHVNRRRDAISARPAAIRAEDRAAAGAPDIVAALDVHVGPRRPDQRAVSRVGPPGDDSRQAGLDER